MGERGLTVRDRIIVHLSKFGCFSEEFECPEDMCQSGISAAIGKSRAHTTLELNRMKEEGLVTERAAHVKGAKSRRKTYCLMPQGIARSNEILRHLESLSIRYCRPDGSKTMSGREAVENLLSDLGKGYAIAVDAVLGCGGTLDAGAFAPKPASAHTSSIPPRLDTFIQRSEVGNLVEHLGLEAPNTCIVLGLPGVGKTALLTETAWRLAPDARVFYKRLYRGDSGSTVLHALGSFLGEYGFPGLDRHLTNLEGQDLPETCSIMSDTFRKSRFIIMFDEYEHPGDGLRETFDMLVRSVNGSGSSLVVAASARPDFYGLKSLALDNSVTELTVGGLDDSGSAEFFAMASDGKEVPAKLASAGGHPLLLRFLASGIDPAKLVSYIETEMLEKDTVMARTCRFASVLRRPCMPDDLELLGFAPAAVIRRSPAFEEQANGGYALHRAISSVMLAGTTPRMLSRIHGEAAEHYIAIGSEPLETLHHLVASGNMARAAEFALVEEKKLFGAGNPQDLSAAMGSILGNASAQPGLLEIAARAYDMAGRSDACTVARKIISDWPDSPECPKARILLAKMLAKKGSLDEALGSLADIQKASQEILAETHHTQASILRRLCRLEEAAGECEKAMTFSKKNTILQARCLMESALINSALGRNGDALLELDSAGALVRQCESEPDIIRCGMNRGVILRALGRNEEALEELESAVKLAGESGQNRLRAQGLANLTELLNIGGDFTRSADLASQAIGLFTALQEPIMLAVSKFNMGEALAGLGRREEAIRVGDEAVTLLVEHNLVKSRGKWIKDYAKLLDGMGERKKAAALRAKLR